MTRADVCAECPLGLRGSCAEDGATEATLLADPGFFLLNTSGQLSALPCAPGACIGGVQQCAPHREGFLCADCESGFSEWQSVCAKCDSAQAGYVLLFILLSGLYLLFSYHTAEDSGGLTGSRNLLCLRRLIAVWLAVFVGFCQVSLLVAGEQVQAIDW